MHDELDLFEEIRQNVEEKLASLRNNALPGQRWVNIHGPADTRPSNYEVLQTYVLLKILDTVESIDDTLITIMANQAPGDKP